MKMRGKRRKWGRCKLHGQHCEVAHDIRENTSTRASEKEEAIKEIKKFNLENNMARIEGNTWIIEDVEEAQAIVDLINSPPKINPKLQEALDDYKALTNSDLKSFTLFDKEET